MNFYSNGKLLLTAEYLVLNGAKSLALPTKFGQDLIVTELKENISFIYWKSFDLNKNVWLHCSIDYSTFKVNSIEVGEDFIALKLASILKEANRLNPKFLTNISAIEVETNLDFDRSWGLGTSSTLINNIAQWANVNPFELQFACFGGSGYDIACASNDTPIIYSLMDDKQSTIKQVEFKPIFKEHLFFVHLNKKQNSRDAISNYKEQNFNLEDAIFKVNEITDKMILCNSLSKFEELIVSHESLLSTILKEQPVKDKYFKDYFGGIKSLGAWGGDFVLVTGNENTKLYFNSKGYPTVIPFSKMIK